MALSLSAHDLPVLILLSPAKKLNFAAETPPAGDFTAPGFETQSRELARLMGKKSPSQLRKLQGISPALAEMNHRRWQDWSRPEEPAEDCRPAIFTFAGDVYQGLDAQSLSDEELRRAQRHLRILSGLHGLLRPLDMIRPYRLEMGTRLANSQGRDLYAMWRERITAQLRQELADSARPWVLNLASAEYARAVDFDALALPVVEPVFRNLTKAGWRPVSFSAKRARGAMAAWAIRQKITRPEQLEAFDWTGYQFQPDSSQPSRPAFHRRQT